VETGGWTFGDRWTPGIGDPSRGGWLTVFLYGIAAILCFRTFLMPGRLAKTGGVLSVRERWGWLALSVLMAFLCLNKQLDLQSLFTHIGRDIARQQGWYGERRAVQKLFVIGFGGMSAVFGATILWFSLKARNAWVRLATLGAVLLCSYIVIRAASFHHVELITDASILGLRWNWIFENVPILMIITAALQSSGRTIEDLRS
jgi:hypothetical protein